MPQTKQYPRILGDGGAMVNRRVYIVWLHALFHETVRLVLSHPGIEVVGASSEYPSAQDEISALQPDTVIVEQTEDDTAISPEARQILESSSWSPRVICMDMENNELWVYSRERLTIGQGKDFLDLIRDI